MSREVVVALDDELAAVLDVLRDVDEDDFARVTNCPPWTLKELAVHINGTTRLPPEFQPSAERPQRAADYYRRPERSTPQYRDHNVEQTQRAAARFACGTDVVRQLERTRHEVIARLDVEDLQRVIAVPRVGALTVEGFAATRVLAVAAHALDVAITLGRNGQPSPAALRVCVPICADLFGEELPPELPWTTSEFFGRATGRIALDEHDIALLGTAAERFPLIS